MPSNFNAPKAFFFSSLAIMALGGSFAYGVLATKKSLFPVPQLNDTYAMLKELVQPSDRILQSTNVRHAEPIATLSPDEVSPGLMMIMGAVNTRDAFVRIVDRTGRVIHEWQPVWSEIWPNAETVFPAEVPLLPRGDLGMYLHGIDILPDASFVANFEHLSTFRMDVCGNVLWKLDNLGHHAVHLAEDDTLWVTAEDWLGEEVPDHYPMHRPPLRSWTVQNIDADGTVLDTIPIIDVLQKNDMLGLLYMSSTHNRRPWVTGDTLHLNDVDTFPSDLSSEVFAPGDLMLSLRNINTIFVMDPETWEIKFISTGHVMRHHDPDFIAGDKISVFDNRNLGPSSEEAPLYSRIVELDVATGAATPVLTGDGEEPFYTMIMGVHQRLPNGNILVINSDDGRVLEFSADQRLVWRYSNRIDDTTNGRVYMAMVLPETMDEAFFEERIALCN